MRKGRAICKPISLDYLCKLKNGGPDISLDAGHRLMEHVTAENVHITV
jgi:hypothetical protein